MNVQYNIPGLYLLTKEDDHNVSSKIPICSVHMYTCMCINMYPSDHDYRMGLWVTMHFCLLVCFLVI